MYMYPRTAPEAVYCGMTAQVARHGGVERANPPRMCLDILAQHLVSMASGESYSIADVMDVLGSPIHLPGDQEGCGGRPCHAGGRLRAQPEMPARPRILYDRIHGRGGWGCYAVCWPRQREGPYPIKGCMQPKQRTGGVRRAG